MFVCFSVFDADDLFIFIIYRVTTKTILSNKTVAITHSRSSALYQCNVPSLTLPVSASEMTCRVCCVGQGVQMHKNDDKSMLELKPVKHMNRR